MHWMGRHSYNMSRIHLLQFLRGRRKERGGVLVSFLKAKSPLLPSYSILFLSRSPFPCQHLPLIANLTETCLCMHHGWSVVTICPAFFPPSGKDTSLYCGEQPLNFICFCEGRRRVTDLLFLLPPPVGKWPRLGQLKLFSWEPGLDPPQPTEGHSPPSPLWGTHRDKE